MKTRKLNPYKIESYGEFYNSTVSELKNYLHLKGFGCLAVGNKPDLVFNCIDVWSKYGSVKK